MFPGKIVAIIGNSGIGKTTLVQALEQRGRFNIGLESHANRPFQLRLAAGLRQFALPNQVDYLLLRAEQEVRLRSLPGVGLVDGGLDQDFWVFTRRFHHVEWLDADEYALCERFYRLARAMLPAPDLTIHLAAPPEIAAARLEQRRRAVEVAKTPDLAALQRFLDDWLIVEPPPALATVDANQGVGALVEQCWNALEAQDWMELISPST